MQEQNKNTPGSPDVGFPLLLDAEYGSLQIPICSCRKERRAMEG
jgi:hypothetical protein